jgi:hypothetical protein
VVIPKRLQAAGFFAAAGRGGLRPVSPNRHGDDAELVSLNAAPAGASIGTALIKALTTKLRAEDCEGLWLTMTNANLPALRFYLRRGFRLMLVRLGAVDEARKLKPSIRPVGEYGIPLSNPTRITARLRAARPVPALVAAAGERA